MDMQDMMNAGANALSAELDNSIDFIHSDGRIVGIWVARFPSNCTERSFLSAYCNLARARSSYVCFKIVIDAIVDRLYDGRFTKTRNAKRGGYDIMFEKPSQVTPPTQKASSREVSSSISVTVPPSRDPQKMSPDEFFEHVNSENQCW